MTRWTNWGGSIVTFIAVTVILLAGLVGSIYLLNQRTQQAVNEETTASQSEDNKTSSGNTKDESNDSSSSVSTKTEENAPSISQSGLPQTGPGQIINELIAVYTLSISATSFLMSRKKS